jgi:hypothetical protein
MAAMDRAADDRFTCDHRFPAAQVLRLCSQAIAAHRLDLSGLRVLTEAGVGYRRVAAVVAALAGAPEVFAVSRDTVHAGRRDAEAQTEHLAKAAAVLRRLRLVPTRLQAPLDAVDVVTDLPGVRPIDESILRNLSDTAVVTLMRGVAQWRPADVDVAGCRRAGIAVAGLDEEAVGLLRYAPLLFVRGLMELGVEAVGGTVVVAGAGRIYPYVVRALAQLGARVLVAAPESGGRIALYGGAKIGDVLAETTAIDRLGEADALVLAADPPGGRLLGPGTATDASAIARAAPHLAIVCGGAETEVRAAVDAGLRVWPSSRDGGNAVVADFLPRPVVESLVAGLKVGEVMARARRGGSSPVAAEQAAAAQAHAELLPKDVTTVRF